MFTGKMKVLVTYSQSVRAKMNPSQFFHMYLYTFSQSPPTLGEDHQWQCHSMPFPVSFMMQLVTRSE